MSGFIEKVVGDVGDKQRWREYKARVKALPSGYRTAVDALERYLAYRGVISNGEHLVSMHEELADVFERAATEDIPIRDLVGADPVQFANVLLGKYSHSDKERRRLIDAIARAEVETGSAHS